MILTDRIGLSKSKYINRLPFIVRDMQHDLYDNKGRSYTLNIYNNFEYL